MSQQDEEKQLLFRRQRGKQAIAQAMEGQWREAIATNKEIIEGFPNDVDAYNRLGRACLELGEYSKAKEAYGRALELDPYNAITKKNLQRLSYLKGKPVNTDGLSRKAEPRHFIKETGKTREVYLYDLAPKEILAREVAGDGVNLRVDAPNLVAENTRGEYLGKVDLRHAKRLIKLMESGNKYTAAVISSAEDMLIIIIREVYQDPSQAGRLSFPLSGSEDVRPFVRDRVLKMKTEDDEGAGESGYTIIGGGEVEVVPEESENVDDEIATDED